MLDNTTIPSSSTLSASTQTLNTQTKIQRLCYRLALFTTVFAFCVAVLGAYTRLTDAGLGCPDWPGCYGQLVLSQDFSDNHQNINGFNLKKAWTEMAHRYLAGTLGVLIVLLTACLVFFRSSFITADPSTANANPKLYSNHFDSLIKIALSLVGLVIFQAALGMWTVTLKLFPAIVMAHLLGGLSMLALLYWLTLSLKPQPNHNISFEMSRNQSSHLSRTYQFWSMLALTILSLQLFLGGWTSANYAALVCLDFPACYAGQYMPTDLNLSQAFNFFAERNTAGITIHMAHRLGALITALILYSLCFQAYRHIPLNSIRQTLLTIVCLLSMQILLGILNVVALLPLSIAVAHHAVAALLLLALVQLNFQFYYFNPYAKPISY